jgi:uncharacterized protein HemX
MTVRIATYAVVAVLALLIGLGVGYYLWGMRAADLDRQLQQQRSEYEFRLSEQEQRARTAEDRARREAEARKVFEEELHKIRPLK